MDRGAWWATVHGSQRVGHDWVTNTQEEWSFPSTQQRDPHLHVRPHRDGLYRPYFYQHSVQDDLSISMKIEAFSTALPPFSLSPHQNCPYFTVMLWRTIGFFCRSLKILATSLPTTQFQSCFQTVIAAPYFSEPIPVSVYLDCYNRIL